jgi:hypothetical protein
MWIDVRSWHRFLRAEKIHPSANVFILASYTSAPLRRNDGNGGKAMKPRTEQILNQEISLDRDPHGRVGLMPPSKSWEKREISL